MNWIITILSVPNTKQDRRKKTELDKAKNLSRINTMLINPKAKGLAKLMISYDEYALNFWTIISKPKIMKIKVAEEIKANNIRFLNLKIFDMKEFLVSS